MARYRARICPNCKYFVGFSISRSPASNKEVGVSSFCLNCNYRLPIHAVVQGIKRATARFRVGPLKPTGHLEVCRNDSSERAATPGETQNNGRNIPAEHYSSHLRTIGQQLQQHRIDIFNLQCTERGYAVWTRDHTLTAPSRYLFNFNTGRLERWWGIRSQAQAGFSAAMCRMEYSLEDLAAMESRARVFRDKINASADGHSLSQLLRTIGSLVYQRNHRLLAISWRDLSVCIVVETAQGKREIDVFRPDNLYDIWVRMYLKRQNRALSDVPR